jgi:hypothetical protein
MVAVMRWRDGGDERNVEALVSRLRRKLDEHVDAAALIQTVRGEGSVLARRFTGLESETTISENPQAPRAGRGPA